MSEYLTKLDTLAEVITMSKPAQKKEYKKLASPELIRAFVRFQKVVNDELSPLNHYGLQASHYTEAKVRECLWEVANAINVVLFAREALLDVIEEKAQ